MDMLHPDILLQHAIQPTDYKSGLVFRSAVESIRGSFIASSTTGREGLVKDVLDNMLQRGYIVNYAQNSSRTRYDFTITLEQGPDRFAAIEVKGGEGNSINISERPLWAREFGVWCHLDGAVVNQPAHGAHSIVNRLTNELVRRQKLVDVLFFKDILCGTRTRPCPKYPGHEQDTGLETAPDVFLFPQRVPSLDDPEPPVHTLDTLEIASIGFGFVWNGCHVVRRAHLAGFCKSGRAIQWNALQSCSSLASRTGHRGKHLSFMASTGVSRLSDDIQEARQLYLFDDTEMITKLDARLWHGSFNSRESTLQQLSPYVGKMKSGMAQVLVNLYSEPGEVVLDPFSGSGVVPLEAALAGRQAWANDLSPYAYVLTRGKLDAPGSEKKALQKAKSLLDSVEQQAISVNVDVAPEWVQAFFHPDTLREVLAAFGILHQQEDYFLTSCLLGILHHVRPGFLSYPASHLVPYLRKNKYPPDEFPEMYAYRDLRSRLLAKVKRAYRRHSLPVDWEQRQCRIWQVNSMDLPIQDGAVNAVISSPPYFGALDYARDNRLRLWFLGCKDWKELDASLTANRKVYLSEMRVCLQEIYRVLGTKGYCVLVLGDVDRDGKIRRTAEILAELAQDASSGGFIVETIYDDKIPDDRRSRRRTRTTKFERILVMRKTR